MRSTKYGGDTSFVESWPRICTYVHFEFSFGGIFEILRIGSFFLSFKLLPRIVICILEAHVCVRVRYHL